jgi:hypothetical protein
MPSANGHVPNAIALIPASACPTKSLRKWGRIDTNGGQQEISIRYKLQGQLVRLKNIMKIFK